MATKDPPDSQPRRNVGGRPPALHDIVAEHAQASLQKIADELHHRCGVRGGGQRLN